MPTQSFADFGFYTGNHLVELMRDYEFTLVNADASPQQFVNSADYTSYILGVFDATIFQYNLTGNVKVRQIIAIVTNYLKNHPEEWGNLAAPLVMKAVQEAFP